MMRVPAIPTALPDDHRSRGTMPLRFEDVAQDGRLVLDALPHGVGAVWRGSLRRHATVELFRDGVIPVMSKLVVEGTGGPVAVRESLDAEGAFSLAHTVDASGSVDRLLLHMWVDAFGPRGRTYGTIDGAGERIHLGRVYVEHVFSRPFGPKERRKVLAFEHATLPAVPAERSDWIAPDAFAELPEGADPLEDESPDPSLVLFGLSHTDSNQHVNSLVYPRIVEEAALRTFARLGKPTALLAKSCAMAYRKPFFAGDRARIVVRPFKRGERLGVACAIGIDGGDRRCFAQMEFEG